MRHAISLLCGMAMLLGACSSPHGPPPPMPPPDPPAKLANGPLIVFPTQNGPTLSPPAYEQACLNPTQWPTGWAKMQAMGWAVQFWDEWIKTDPTAVAQCFANLKSAGKGIVIEGWALKPPGNCTSAQACWDLLSPIFAEIAALNPPPMTVAIDEPLTGSAAYDTLDQAIAGTVQWIGMLRSAYPGMPVILDETYPGNNAQQLIAYWTGVNAATPGGIQYAALDHNWQTSPNTADVLTMERGVHAAGLKFEVIFWDASTVGADWTAGLLHHQQLYADAGITPDLICIEDWVGFPAAIVPETDPASFTGSVATFIGMLGP